MSNAPTDVGPVTLRPAAGEDGAFLRELYASTRSAEMALTGWAAEQQAAFLGQQFVAQHRDYHQNYPGARFQVVERGGEPVGRLYVDRREDEVRVIDIALLPGHRGQGIGGWLMAGVLAEADAAGLPVRIHVELNNPALRLYRRLGFGPVAENGVYLLMERPAPAVPADGKR